MDIIPIILTIHVLIVLALIGVVLLQRSEGGALGIGGGGSGGGFMSGRGAANALTRLTSVLAFMFFATSLGLAMVADKGETGADIVNDITGAAPDAGVAGEIDAADDLGGIFSGEDDTPAVESAPNADPLGEITTEVGETEVPESVGVVVDPVVDVLPDFADDVTETKAPSEDVPTEESDPQ